MRTYHAIFAAMIALAICPAAATAQAPQYELFPGYGGERGYPPTVNYYAWVLSYKDSKHYTCVASYEVAAPATPKLNCTFGGSFEPPLLSGPNVKTMQALGGPRAGPGTDEARSSFFWQIDQATGKVQFCMPVAGTNCAAFQIP
jgi:hypothetical protein